jgi:hypothetical protein
VRTLRRAREAALVGERDQIAELTQLDKKSL